MCFACRTAAVRLHLALTPVLPVALCPLPGSLYAVLMGYKESPIVEVRQRHGQVVRRLFGQFIAGHRTCITELLAGPAQLVLPVPSSSRPGSPPLDRVPGLGGHVTEALEPTPGRPLPWWCPGLLKRSGGRVGHMAAHPGAFVVAPWARAVVSGKRVLLIDDTYVSGARAQSAAAALRLAGASSVLIVPLGRVIRPDTLATHDRLLRRSRASRSVPTCCARCVVAQPETGLGTE